MHRFLSIPLVISVLLVACKDDAPRVDGKAAASASGPAFSSAAPSSAPPVASATPAAGPDAARDLVKAWSRALDTHDTTALGTMYAPRVRFYGRELPASSVIAMKQHALGPKSSFHQSIIGDITIDETKPGVYRASFVKESGSDKQRRVKASLELLAGDGGSLAIDEETDDASIARAKEKAHEACEAALTSAVSALPQVKKLLADTQKAVDADKTGSRRMGGLGPLDEENGFTMSLGVHTDERYEALVWYGLHGGDVSVTVMGDDAKLPAADLARVRTACKATGDAGP